MSAGPLLSVCFVTYNHENYIAQSLEGILNQNVNFSYEIVVGEDLSPDGTRRIVTEYQSRYPDKIRLLDTEKNLGGQKNALRTLLECKGKYIAFLEGDDFWTDNNKLQMQVDFLEKNPDFSMCFTEVNHVGSDGGVIRNAGVKYTQTVFTHDEYVAKVKSPTLTTIIRKSAVPDPLPDQIYKVFNLDMFIKSIVSEQGKTKYFPHPTGSYRIHPGGIYSSSSYQKKIADKITTYQIMMGYFKSSHVKLNLVKAINVSYLKLFFHFIKNFNVLQAGKMMMMILKLSAKHPTSFPISYVSSKIKKKW